MATKGNRDVKLTVQAGVSGESDIRRLAGEIRGLGKEGADAAPQLSKIADELEQLAGQSGAIETVKRLTGEVDELNAKQRNAATTAAGVKAAYAEQKAATDALRDSVRAHAEAYDDAKAKAIGAKEGYAKLRAEIGSLAEASDAERAQLRAAKVAQTEATAARDRAKVALDGLKREMQEALAAERELAKQHEKTAAAEAKANTALREREVALSDANAAARQAGVAVNDLANAEEAVAASFRENVAVAQRLHESRIDLLEADRLLAIEEKTLADMHRKAQQALLAEVATYNEATGAANRFQAAQDKAAAASREQAEADRLAIIQANAMADARRRAATELEAEAAAQRDAAAVIARYDAQLAEARAEQERFAQAAREAKAALDQAFSATGVRSLQAIQTEINETAAALAHLERQAAGGAISQRDLERATGAAQLRLQQLRGELSSMPSAVGVFERMNEQVLSLVNRFGALTAAVATVGFAVKPLFDATTQLESMRRVLTQVFGSLDAANREIEFLNDVADRAGVRVDKIGESYTRFAVSAKTAGIETATVRAVFEATTLAAGNLGLSTDKTTHILDALAQMANKGKVSMEELRQQLGDSLPGALGLMAKGLGVTVPQLVELVETGQLLTEHALKPMAEAMTELASKEPKVQSLTAAFARLQNGITLAYQKAADTQAYKVLTNVLDGVAANFDKVVVGAKFLTEALITAKIVSYVTNLVSLRTATAEVATTTATATAATAANTAATVQNSAATTANTAVKAANTAANTANAASWAAIATGLGGIAPAAQRADAQTGVLSRGMTALGNTTRTAIGYIGGLPGILAGVVLNAKELGTWVGESAARMTGWGKVLDENERKFREHNEQLAKMAEAQQKTGAEWVRLGAQYAQSVKPLEKNIEAAKEYVKVAKEQGDSISRIASLSGDEAQRLEAAARAADLNAAASKRLATEEGARTAALEQYLLALEKQAQMQGRISDAEKKRLDELHAELKVLRETRAEAQAKAETDRVAAEAAKLAIEATKDHSAQLGALKDAYERATAEVAKLKAAQEQGLATQEQVTAAEERAAKALFLYRDAINDTRRALDLQGQSQRTRNAEISAGITVREAAVAADLKQAQILGDVTAATNAEIRAKELQIERIRQSASERVAEANLQIKKLETDRAEIKGMDDASVALRQSIDFRIREQQAKIAQAAASKEVIRGIQLEIDAINQRNNALAGSLSSSFDQTKNQARSTIGGPTYDKDGFATDSSGQRITAGSQMTPPDASGDWTFISDATANGGSQTVTLPDGRRTTGVGVSGVGYWVKSSGVGAGFGVRTGNGSASGAFGGGATSGESMGGFGVNNVAAGAPAPAPSPAPAPAGSPSSGTSSLQPVVININGRQTTVNVANRAEADALSDFLRLLAEGAATAGG